MDAESGTATVVWCDGDSAVRDAIRAALTEDDRLECLLVDHVEGVERALVGAGPVECVVTGETIADGDWRDVVDTVRDHHANLPIVLSTDEPDGEVAGEATAAGVDEYVPDPAAAGLRERIRSVVDAYRDLRQRNSESTRYRQIMETLPLSLYFKDEDARYTDVSASLEADDVELIGNTDADVWGDQEGSTGLATYRDDLEVIESGEPIEGKEEHHQFSNDDNWFQTYKYPWRDDDGGIRGLFGMTRNVTAQKERERELRQKSQRLEQFASFVSHDLRNPINIAQGYLDLARDTGDESAFDEVEASLERMETLIDDLLVTVRRGDGEAEWIDFAPFVERTWTVTETEDVHLEVDVPDGATVAAVPGQLRQVLDNLFRNADEHASSSPRSHAREDADKHTGDDVTVTVGLTDTGFYVEDDGVGVDPELQETLFEYGVTEGGTGIGLAIVREIADSHGWEVGLTESEAGGARFEFGNCAVRSTGGSAVVPAGEISVDRTTDVGDPTPPTSVERSADGRRWTVDAGGADVWQDVEEHFFGYGTVEGDARIVARVTEFEAVHEFSKAGVVLRDGTDVGSALAYVGVSGDHGSECIHRSTADGRIETEQFPDADEVPRWYRLDWIDDTVSLETSTGGDDWTVLDRLSVDCEDPVTVGVAVCSHDPEQTCHAVFEDVRAVRLRPAESGD